MLLNGILSSFFGTRCYVWHWFCPHPVLTRDGKKTAYILVSCRTAPFAVLGKADNPGIWWASARAMLKIYLEGLNPQIHASSCLKMLTLAMVRQLELRVVYDAVVSHCHSAVGVPIIWGSLISTNAGWWQMRLICFFRTVCWKQAGTTCSRLCWELLAEPHHLSCLWTCLGGRRRSFLGTVQYGSMGSDAMGRQRESNPVWQSCIFPPSRLMKWDFAMYLLLCPPTVSWDHFRGWGLQRLPDEFHLLKQDENLNYTVNKINLSVHIPLNDQQSHEQTKGERIKCWLQLPLGAQALGPAQHHSAPGRWCAST